MSNKTTTPGEWLTGTDGNRLLIMARGEGIIAEVNQAFPHAKANADVLKASKDLLKALKFALAGMEEIAADKNNKFGFGLAMAIKEGRAAISKAEGGAA